MSHDHEFDELARRKLEERSFPFEEAHWQAVQQALGGRHQRRRSTGLRFGAAVLVLLLASALWWWPENGNSPLVAEGSTANDMEHHAATTTGATPSTTSMVRGEPTGPGPGRSIGGPVARTAAGSEAPSTPPQSRREVAPHGTPTAEREAAALSPVDIRTASNRKVPTKAATDDAAVVIAATDRSTLPDRPAMDLPPRSTDANSDPSENMAIVDPRTGMDDTIPGIVPTTRMAEDASESEAPTEAVMVIDPVLQATHANVDEGPGTGTVPAAEELSVDTRPTGSAPQDSLTAPMEPPFLDALVPHNAPWEIGVLGGMCYSNIRYTGGNSDDWGRNVEPLWTPAWGIEAMHVGRNFGVGTGLHYGSYSERITTEAIDRTTWNTSTYWALTTIDTTILFITDTVQVGGETFYNGIPTTVSIPVLTQGTDSSATTVRAREARQSINRVSYLEVPLLLDAHLMQGRWSIGLRGGPTLGLLMGRQGEVPNSNNDGYVSLPDLPFREVVLGYTARAYVRYRFNAGWSVGMEPMLRGQFGNTLESGDLLRRTSAWGGMLSLTYRLK